MPDWLAFILVAAFFGGIAYFALRKDGGSSGGSTGIPPRPRKPLPTDEERMP